MPCNMLIGHVLMCQAPYELSPFILLAVWSPHSDTALMLCRPVLKAHLSGASHAWPGCKDFPHAVVPLDSGAIHGGLQSSKCRGEAPCTCDPACVTWDDSSASYHVMGGGEKDLRGMTGGCHSLQIRLWLHDAQTACCACFGEDAEPVCRLRHGLRIFVVISAMWLLL